jgi:hypothetical protein
MGKTMEACLMRVGDGMSLSGDLSFRLGLEQEP